MFSWYDLKQLAAEQVFAETERQDAKWGSARVMPNGTGPDSLPLYDPESFLDDSMAAERLSFIMKHRTDAAFAKGDGTWADIFLEEVFEAMAEEDKEKLETELSQVAAVCVSWIASLRAAAQ